MRSSDQHFGPPAGLPLEFTVDERTYLLPVLDTGTVLGALALEPPGCWWQLIPGQLADQQGYRLLERLFDPADPLDLDDVEHVAETVLGRLLGMTFHAGRRLAASAYANWTVFDGWCFHRGQNPLEQPVGRLVAAVYYWRRSMCEKEAELRRLDSDIWAPPPATTAAGHPRDPTPAGWGDTVEAHAFEQAMSVFGGS